MPPEAAIPRCTHIDSASGLVWRTVLRPHTSVSSVLPSQPPHACPCTTSHPPPHAPTSYLSCLMYSASAVSSQASGMGHQAGLVLFSRTPPNVYLSPDAASMQTQAAGHRHVQPRVSWVCRTMVHSARTPTTRPLPRPAAIASRHATSRAMQVTSALLESQAAPAALFSSHSPCLSLSLVHASPHPRPYTARHP
jgi:hypothetical protein